MCVEVRVPHSLAVAVEIVLHLAVGQDVAEQLLVERQQRRAHLLLGRRHHAAVAGEVSQPLAVLRAELEMSAEVGLLCRAPADAQEVDDLDEQAGLAARRLAHAVDQLAQARDEALVADAQERPGRDVADAGRLDHQHAGAAGGEARVPVDDVVGDEAVVGGAPRDHGRHPGALASLHRSDVDRREEEGGLGLFARRPARLGERMADALGGMPHRPGYTTAGTLRRDGRPRAQLRAVAAVLPCSDSGGPYDSVCSRGTPRSAPAVARRRARFGLRR